MQFEATVRPSYCVFVLLQWDFCWIKTERGRPSDRLANRVLALIFLTMNAYLSAMHTRYIKLVVGQVLFLTSGNCIPFVHSGKNQAPGANLSKTVRLLLQNDAETAEHFSKRL